MGRYNTNTKVEEYARMDIRILCDVLDEGFDEFRRTKRDAYLVELHKKVRAYKEHWREPRPVDFYGYRIKEDV